MIGHTLRVELHEARAEGVSGAGVPVWPAAAARGSGRAGGFSPRDRGRCCASPEPSSTTGTGRRCIPAPVFRAAYDRLVADHGERPGSSSICTCSSWRRRKRWSRSSRCCRRNWRWPGKWRASQVRRTVGAGGQESHRTGRPDARVWRLTTRCWKGRWPMSADTLEMLLREFCLPTMAARCAEMMPERRGAELGLSQAAAALVRSRGGRPAGAQAATAAARVRAARGQDAGQPGGRPTAGQSAAPTAHAAGRRLCGAGGEPAGLRSAGPGQDALSVRAGPGADPAARYAGLFHADVQAGAAAAGRQEGAAAGCSCSRSWTALTPSSWTTWATCSRSREEMEVLFTFLAERYERRSVLVSSNLVFSKWDQIFKDPMTTMAAMDRLVHHAIILEFDGESHASATARKKRAAANPARPPAPSAPLRLWRLAAPKTPLRRRGWPRGSETNNRT